jgi:2'-5' RNA ligase
MNAPTMMIRSFIALSCPIEIQQFAREIQHRFKVHDHHDAWRWVSPENLHLTLRFLGKIHQNGVSDLHEAIIYALQEQATFSLQFQGLGCFPHPARPRVLWMGINDLTRALQSIHKQLTQALSNLGFPADTKPFHPHLTLGRKRKDIKQRNIQHLLNTYHDYFFGTIIVKQIHLYQSQQHQGGVAYPILKSITFR